MGKNNYGMGNIVNEFAVKLVKFIFRLYYSFLSFAFRVNKKKVVIATYRDSELNDNFKSIYKSLSEGTDVEVVLRFRKMNSGLKERFIYVVHLLSSLYHVATCRVLLLDDYYFPLYLINKRSETKVIQIWHACGAFKKFGYSIVGKKSGPSPEYLKLVPVHSNYDYAIVSSKEAVLPFAEAFNMSPEQILPIGVPRTDFFFSKEEKESVKNKFYQKFPHLKSKIKILYAPTYRGAAHNQKDQNLILDREKLFKYIQPEKYEVLIKLHPYLENEYTVDQTYTEQFSLYELMIVSDVLITDYSSVIFEYSLLNKPILFYCPDFDNYMEERDFYFPFDSFAPGPITKNLSSLVKELKYLNSDPQKVNLKEFSKRFMENCDGRSTDRVVSLILGMLTDNDEKRRVNIEV
ncbi:CDP-glycerol glycerophosphotransferase family protein [Bacillus altitudinis]|uniref:CDP-glycerol glycerophosphotransferase family protein n=1 Tax=Bacillus altitudinis TaxID=293387 RepID=UPI001C3ECECE|nr:CDP-glycerol glycerophosphotransferase family protein [Bacillus altitudinis]MDH3108487.1 CDP-glycerol glycerophosphotransferase family protein [Bacillus altitudinis]QXJ49165.1 CDP-glycerol glycerophosphotransferase family protein [Bacillus altitudinis]